MNPVYQIRVTATYPAAFRKGCGGAARHHPGSEGGQTGPGRRETHCAREMGVDGPGGVDQDSKVPFRPQF